MNYKYESIIIVRPNANEEEIDAIITKVENIVNENGNIISFQKLGLKKLSYKIREFEQGYYIQFDFNADSQIITELERYYRLTDDIMKFITVRHNEN